jgi:hypothetical protein
MSESGADGVYGSRSIKRHRRTKAAMGQVHDAILEALAAERPQTVRQVFYCLVSAGRIDKTELQYRAVMRALGEMRRDGRIPFESVADNTRRPMKYASYPNLEAALRVARESYFRSRWDNQPAYVEVWLEKDALSGVVFPITGGLDVPLMVTRGYPSISFLNGAAETIASQGRPCYLYYFGDFDPSGVDITRSVDDGIRAFAPDADVVVKRVAVTEDQIREWKLPSRPTKTTDARAKDWDGGSVELDAIPANTLRRLVKECIEPHIDRKAWAATERAERADRRRLASLIG